MDSAASLKILYLIPDYNFFSLDRNRIGGHIAHIIGVIDALCALGHEVSVCSYDPIPFYDRKLSYLWLRHTRLPLRRIDELVRHYRLARQVRAALRSLKPDLIYVRWAVNLFWEQAFRDKPCPLIFECNTPVSMLLTGGLKQILAHGIDARICKHADLISAVSQEVKDFLVTRVNNARESRIIVNPNGVDNARFTPQGGNLRDRYRFTPEDVVVGFSGNFSFWHGIEELIAAFAAAQAHHPSLKLLLIGTGAADYLARLRELAAQSGASGISFTGPVSFEAMPDYLRTCDILVSPQKVSFGKVFHGSPTKLFEYMAAGRCIICSDIGQMQEIIRDGANGLLFPSGDAAALAAQLSRCAGDARLRQELGANARKDSLELHSWDNNVRRILAGLEKGG